MNEIVRLRTRVTTFGISVLRISSNNAYLDFGINIAHLRTDKKLNTLLCLKPNMAKS
jgi:hypothetical protein